VGVITLPLIPSRQGRGKVLVGSIQASQINVIKKYLELKLKTEEHWDLIRANIFCE
jgi:hypothetical protein